MRGPVQCPDCGEARAFAGYLAEGQASDDVRLFICRDCNVTEKVATDETGAFVFERLNAAIPGIGRAIETIGRPA